MIKFTIKDYVANAIPVIGDSCLWFDAARYWGIKDLWCTYGICMYFNLNAAYIYYPVSTDHPPYEIAYE